MPLAPDLQRKLITWHQRNQQAGGGDSGEVYEARMEASLDWLIEREKVKSYRKMPKHSKMDRVGIDYMVEPANFEEEVPLQLTSTRDLAQKHVRRDRNIPILYVREDDWQLKGIEELARDVQGALTRGIEFRQGGGVWSFEDGYDRSRDYWKYLRIGDMVQDVRDNYVFRVSINVDSPDESGDDNRWFWQRTQVEFGFFRRDDEEVQFEDPMRKIQEELAQRDFWRDESEF